MCVTNHPGDSAVPGSGRTPRFALFRAPRPLTPIQKALCQLGAPSATRSAESKPLSISNRGALPTRAIRRRSKALCGPNEAPAWQHARVCLHPPLSLPRCSTIAKRAQSERHERRRATRNAAARSRRTSHQREGATLWGLPGQLCISLSVGPRCGYRRSTLSAQAGLMSLGSAACQSAGHAAAGAGKDVVTTGPAGTEP